MDTGVFDDGRYWITEVLVLGPRCTKAADRLIALFRSLFDESRFLSAYGLRSLSAVHRDQPYVLHLAGTTATIDYEPAESTTAMFGGNSNWRGPIWFPLNYLVISSLLRYHRTLEEIAQDLRDRLISIFTRGADRRVLPR
jgi:glycogen debranching enzyme